MSEDNGALARIEANISNLSFQIAELRPLLLARSGDLERIKGLEQDVNQLGEKYRNTNVRVDAIEQKLSRWAAYLAGGLAVLQAFWALAGDAVKRYLTGGVGQ